MIPSVMDPAFAAATIKPKLAELRKSTDQLQAMFVEELVKEMRKGAGGEMSQMTGGDIYNGMINQTLSETISKQSDLGISDMLYGQLSKTAIQQVEGQALIAHSQQTQPTSAVQPDKK